MVQMITRNAPEGERSWQQELANAITDPSELLSLLTIDPTPYLAGFTARKGFPMRVPRPFVERMTQGDINDPLLKQVLPVAAELEQVPGYVSDPLVEHDTKTPGMLHKYQSRVLLIVRGGCAVNCRYCFRRHFPYADNSPSKRDWQQSFEYIQRHPEINEVILSGGDPLMANDDQLGWMVKQLEQIPHLKRLRIHSRLPVVIPSRITAQLAQVLQASRLKAVMVLHINHPQEIDNALAAACNRLSDAGVLQLNQSVLLAGINDDADTLCELSEQLFDIGIQPYYLHLLDKVSGAQHFDTDLANARLLNLAMLERLPGFLVPKFVREIGGQHSKTPIDLGLEGVIVEADRGLL
ncbi:EF-P beta-lysylation protein EpmB [Corallincola platygyrae]|uniref:L-lysine 2,3-aminomutase n=1 Tax=Corallincola platygyrae TaxID=1193278 RepID=A0ABW4XM27_9GAMM